MAAEQLTVDLDHIDYSALTVPVARADVRLFRAQTKAAERADPSIRTGLATARTVVTVIAIAVFGSVFFSSIGGVIVSGGGVRPAVAIAFVLIFGIVVAVVARSVFGSLTRWAGLMRLSRFAATNGFSFQSSTPAPNFPGCVFQYGDSRTAVDTFATPSGRFLDFGNYRYTTGSGKSRTTHHWGYLALKLDRALPNMVLDSKANNGLFGSTNLPQVFSRDQVLSLEGDFDKFFTLYCPSQYESDALYIFTPDLMALLIDDAAPFDVEIVDDWMFVYSAEDFDFLDAATCQRLFRIVQTVGAKAVSQTENYRDDRAVAAPGPGPGPGIVAPAGQRLRHGTSIGAIVFFGAIAVFWAWSTFGSSWH
ncbi:MAG TPA: hypothetical protein VGM94_17315 [Galbitalea sp.]|jgi:hypothetical protein